LDVLD